MLIVHISILFFIFILHNYYKFKVKEVQDLKCKTRIITSS